MGGYGSGGWNRTGRVEIESCAILDSAQLLQMSFFEMNAGEVVYSTLSWRDRWDEVFYTASLRRWLKINGDEIILDLPSTHQRIYLQSTPMRFGGVRWYFHCPTCQRRAAKLYKPPGAGFGCRLCHNLTYWSCNKSCRSNRYMMGVGAEMGIDAAEMRAMLRKDRKDPSSWRRKRDRRPDYKGVAAQ